MVSPMNSPEAGSFSHHLNPHRFLLPEVLRLYISALEPWIVWSVSLPSYSSQLSTHKCGTTQSNSHHLAQWVLQLPPCHSFSLPVSASPAGLNECFFFNSLVVRLPYSSIFWHFWLLFDLFFCCCPSFGCERKQSLCTYASILAESCI